MKKLVLLAVAIAGVASAETYTVTVGSGLSSYVNPNPFGYVSLSSPISKDTSSVGTVEMYGRQTKLRLGLSHTLYTKGGVSLSAVSDAGVATTGANVGLDVSAGVGVKVKATSIPLLKDCPKADKMGLAFDAKLHKTSIGNPDGTRGVQPSFSGGLYMAFGK
mgnify:FL=1